MYYLPLFFKIYINDLIIDVIELNVGINIDYEKMYSTLCKWYCMFDRGWTWLTNTPVVLNTLNKWCCSNEIDVNLRRISVITFIRYAQNRKIGKPNNLKYWNNKTKGPKQDRQNRLRSYMGENLRFINN